jgi:hypothetical protein
MNSADNNVICYTPSLCEEKEDEQHINATYSQAPKTKYDDDDDLEKNHQNFKNGTHSHTHTRDTLVNNVKM